MCMCLPISLPVMHMPSLLQSENQKGMQKLPQNTSVAVAELWVPFWEVVKLAREGESEREIF